MSENSKFLLFRRSKYSEKLFLVKLEITGLEIVKKIRIDKMI